MNRRGLQTLFASLLVISSACTSFAANPVSLQEDFRKEGLKIPAQLQKLGYTQFGDLDLKSFAGKVPQVKVIKTSGWTVGEENADGRISARWERHADQRSVTVDTDMWKERPEQRPNLALHEYLGALGYQDKDYWLSTEMWCLSLNDTQAKLTESEKNLIAQRIASQTLVHTAEGGVAGVGGGGEITTLFVRTNNITKDLKEFPAHAKGKERREKLDILFSHLEAYVTVSFLTPKLHAKALIEAQRDVPTACMTEHMTCELPPRRFGTGDQTCICPDDDATPGIVIYPH